MMSRRTVSAIALALAIDFVIAIGVFVGSAPTASAQVPGQVSFQGLLLDAGGQPVTGNVDLAFALFADASGGTPLWSESHPATAVIDGVYDVALGSTTPLTPAVLAGTTRHLEVTVDGETLTPRRPLLAVPYALTAGSLASVESLDGMACLANEPAAGVVEVTIAQNGAVSLACSGVYTLTVSISGSIGNPQPPAVTSSPAGINCNGASLNDCSEAYLGGTVVTLSTSSGVLYLFTGWSGACTGTGPCVVTLDQARSVTANFVPNL
ncbi:MAG: hypothetical protein R3F35_12285 [Myxococcota bacterium]